MAAQQPPAAGLGLRGHGGAHLQGAGAARRERARAGPGQVVGHRSGDGDQLLARGRVEPRDGAEQAVRVRVARGGEEPVALRPLHDPPGVEHVDRLAQPRHDPEVVGDHDERGAGVADELAQQLQDLGLDGDVERGRGLVGDEQPRPAGQCDGDERALPHAAGELVRVGVQPPARVGDADAVEQVGGLGPRGLLPHAAVAGQHLGDLQADRDHRVQRGQRVLEHHRDVPAASLPHLALGERQQVDAVHLHRAGDADAPRRQQPGDRHRRHRLAAPGLPDQADDLPGRDVEAHPVDGDGVGLAAPGEGDGEVADLQQRLAGGRRRILLQRRGHRAASRSCEQVIVSPSGPAPRATTRRAA